VHIVRRPVARLYGHALLYAKYRAIAAGGRPGDLHGSGEIVQDAQKTDFFGKPRSDRAQKFQ
jgi:hypothetical protein